MSHFALKNYWPSLLLSLVLLTGIGICLRKLDCLAIEEIRALITIVFGSATSCLLLSFVWLIQRKPLNRPWPNQGLVLGRNALPSMHPRGRLESLDSSYNDDEDADGRSSPSSVSTISRLELERPPSYNDALVHSKPIDWHWAEKISNLHNTDKLLSTRGRASHIDGLSDWHQQTRHTGQSSQRKISYIQLDVYQLMLSSSPPKYYELHFDCSDRSGTKRQGET